MPNSIEFTIDQGDILKCNAKLVAFKHAQDFYGADKAAAIALSKHMKLDELRLALGTHRVVDTYGELLAPKALFVGTPRLGKFGYTEIRQFTHTVLNCVIADLPQIDHLAMTVHGPDARLALNDKEAFLAQFMVCLAAIQSGQLPQALERISIVEIKSQRVQLLRQTLADFLANNHDVVELKGGTGFQIPTGITADKKRPRIFVAMWFADTLLDTFLFGIQQPILAAGYLPVRVDQEYVSGHVFADIQRHIRNAELVVADLSGDRPNVYLEVGYALAKGKKPILLNPKGHTPHFDVQGLNWIEYTSPEDLRPKLAKVVNQHISHKAYKHISERTSEPNAGISW